MTINLRQWDVFRLIMQTRNLTETARLLRVSQPAVSQTLKEMEAELGLSLFVRRGSRISPTGEARLMLPEVERLLTQSRAVASRAIELRDAGGGGLSLASTPNVAGIVLPPALAAFSRERPRVQLRVNAYTIQEVVRQVRMEGADLGFVYAPVDDPSIAIEPLMRARMVCVMPQDSPLAGAPEITPAGLLKETIILVDPSTAPGFLLRARLDDLGIKLDRVIETNFSFTAMALVRHRLGIFVTDPVILLSGLGEGLAVRPLTPAVNVVLTAIHARHRPVPRLAVRLMVHLRATLAAMCLDLATGGCDAQIM